MGTTYAQLMVSGTDVYANSAPSLLTKEIKDLAQSEVLISSLVGAAFLIAVLLGFGIKTYLHQRKTGQSAPEEIDGAESAAAPVLTEFRAASAPEVPKPATTSTATPLRHPEPAMRRVENQARRSA